MSDEISCNDKTILELGAGTGVITKKILDKLSSEQSLLSVELNPEFKEDLDCLVHNNFTYKIINYLDLPSSRYDIIVSGLPLVSLPNRQKIVKKIFNETNVLIQFSYNPFLGKFFKGYDISKKMVFENIPPAWVYTIKKNGSK